MFNVNTASVQYWLDDEELEQVISSCDETYNDILSHFGIRAEAFADVLPDDSTFGEMINYIERREN
jgi:hypothetical protein